MLTSSRLARAWVALSLGTILGILACGKSDPTEPPPPDRLTIKEVVDGTGWFPEVASDSNAWAVAVDFDSTGGEGESLACTDFQGAQTRALVRYAMLVPDADLLYPGAILQWASLGGLAPLPVVADRSSGTLELSAPAGGEVNGPVVAVEPDEVAAWRIAALDQLGDVPSGPWELEAGIVYGPEHLAVLAGLGTGGMTESARERLSYDAQRQGHVLLRLRRVHHAIACPYPGSAAGAFTRSVAGNDLVDQMAEGNPPVWVASVDHGQLLLVLVQADAASAEVLASAVASFAAAAEDRALDAGAVPVHELPGLDLGVEAVGADADAALAAAVAGQDALTDYLQGAPDAAVDLPPITATLEALRDGSSLARGVSASFGFTSCEVHEPFFDDVLWAFKAADARTTWVDGDLRSVGNGRFRYDGGTRIYTERLVDWVPDLVGQGGNAVPFDRRPVFLEDAVNGRPAIELFELPLSEGVLTSELRFDGSLLVGRNYTIFLVYGHPNSVGVTFTTPAGDVTNAGQNRTNFFLHGADNGTLRNLVVGYPQRGLMRYSHNNQLVEFPHPFTDGWHVYALRFGVTTGMAVFWDGELLDEDVTDNSVLQQLSGATLCARWRNLPGAVPNLAAFWLVEIVAYDGAGSTEMVQQETLRLQQKYGIAP